jgi:hypothetical protein
MSRFLPLLESLFVQVLMIADEIKAVYRGQYFTQWHQIQS